MNERVHRGAPVGLGPGEMPHVTGATSSSRRATPAELPLVLLVDDDRDTLAAMAEILHDEGYAAVVAADGGVALSSLRAGLRPTVILLDRTMPPPDGETVLAAMQTDPALAGIPVVWMSADPRPPPRGVVGWLKKPFDLRDLLTILETACHRSASIT